MPAERLPITVSAADRDELRALARPALQAIALPQTLEQLNPGPWGTTEANLHALGALETGLAIVVAVRRALIGRIEADRRSGFAAGSVTATEERFASLVATTVGLHEALAALAVDSGMLPPGDKQLPSDQYRELLTGSEDALLTGLAADLAAYLTFYRQHPDSSMAWKFPVAAIRACAGPPP